MRISFAFASSHFLSMIIPSPFYKRRILYHIFPPAGSAKRKFESERAKTHQRGLPLFFSVTHALKLMRENSINPRPSIERLCGQRNRRQDQQRTQAQTSSPQTSWTYSLFLHHPSSFLKPRHPPPACPLPFQAQKPKRNVEDITSISIPPVIIF